MGCLRTVQMRQGLSREITAYIEMTEIDYLKKKQIYFQAWRHFLRSEGETKLSSNCSGFSLKMFVRGTV